MLQTVRVNALDNPLLAWWFGLDGSAQVAAIGVAIALASFWAAWWGQKAAYKSRWDKERHSIFTELEYATDALYAAFDWRGNILVSDPEEAARDERYHLAYSAARLIANQKTVEAITETHDALVKLWPEHRGTHSFRSLDRAAFEAVEKQFSCFRKELRLDPGPVSTYDEYARKWDLSIDADESLEPYSLRKGISKSQITIAINVLSSAEIEYDVNLGSEQT